MFKKISWFTSRIICVLIEAITKPLIKKDENFWLFGLNPAPYKKDLFIHNSKYLFLYLNSQKHIKTAWLCEDKKMLKTFRENGIKNVYSRKSLKGIYSILKAKYWFCDYNANQVTRFNSSKSNSIVINFWHGAGGLKKVVYDAQKGPLNFSGDCLQNKIYRLLRGKNDYFVVNSDYERLCRESAFKVDNTQIPILGSPRLAALYHDVPFAALFMKKDAEQIKVFKNNNKKIILYVPTFRDTGKDVSVWLKSKRLQSILQDNNTILVCKLHPIDVNSLDFELPETIYKMDNEADIYPVLKYSDGLITDYSSIYFDYLLLDKPIIYHIPDIKEYTEQCRGFYRDYETLTAGVYTKTEDELLAAIQDVVNGVDNYKEQRKKLRDEMFVYQDGNNCKRNFEFVKGLES